MCKISKIVAWYIYSEVQVNGRGFSYLESIGHIKGELTFIARN
jgi:hypothetical protein